MIDEYIEKANKWFKDNNKECPKLVKDWVHVGKTIPPGMGRDALKSRGIKVSDIINGIYKAEITRSNNKVNLDYNQLGLIFVAKTAKPADKKHYNLIVKCKSCSKNLEVDYGLVVRWQEKGLKYCSNCRKATGKTKDIEYYKAFLNLPDEFILKKVYGRKALIKHTLCNTLFERTVCATKARDTESICCPQCESKKLKYKRIEGFDSLIEKELTELLVKLLPQCIIQKQVLYSKVINTERKFRADIFIPEYNTIIEITSRNNNLPNYNKRLGEKENLLKNTNIKLFIAKTQQDIKDIVQSLEKSKESD